MLSKNKIFALMTVKNEDDIVIETLDNASIWADYIFILDNGSTDNTWKILVDYAKKNKKIILWGRYEGSFYLALRQVIYREFKSYAQLGDWWCRLDGDEFYIDDPREFLSSLDEDIDHVYNASFQYYYTHDDYQRERNNESKISVTKRLQWYKCNHSEIRFVKHNTFICWPQNSEWPINLNKPYHKRIRLKHYQYRDIQQIIERLRARNAPNSGSSFSHEKVSVDEWYRKRGFSVPSNIEHANIRIVRNDELENNNDFIYEDLSLPPIVYPNLKRKIKSMIVNFYMRFLNKYFFNI
ncbi:glycosyltransferase family 2 protein [Pluralibacter gergoviae]|uniref:glycosyltransferase family 2 protein n=1 Tax=Pluralibacter gergoviae TaxID=61647 RepID=UPI000907E056|nr:glycosyltransferase family 2 protein [Pluralibacter gergoviae]